LWRPKCSRCHSRLPAAAGGGGRGIDFEKEPLTQLISEWIK